MMTKLLDALRQRFRTPQEAVEALGLDAALLDPPVDDTPPVIAHDDAPAPPWADRRFTPAMAQDSVIVKDAGTHEGAVKAAATRASHGSGSAAIKPLHLQQTGNPYPHSATTHEALAKHHEERRANTVNNYTLASAYRQAAGKHKQAAIAIRSKDPNARKMSTNAHAFTSQNRLD